MNPEHGVPGREGPQGREGAQGREGRAGVGGGPGPVGGAGPAGAAGADGPKGGPGPAGATGIGRFGAIILFAIVLFAIGFSGVKSDQRSCQRQADPRAAQQAKYLIDGLRAEQISKGEVGLVKAVNLRYASIYKELAATVPKLHCGGLRPDVGADNTKQVQTLLDKARNSPTP